MRRLPPVTIFKECTWMQVQTELQTNKSSEIRCKFGLILFLLLGAALIAAGIWGINQYNESGFDQEAAYSYIHQLTSPFDIINIPQIMTN